MMGPIDPPYMAHGDGGGVTWANEDSIIHAIPGTTYHSQGYPNHINAALDGLPGAEEKATSNA